MVTTIKITGDGVFIQSNGGVGGAGGGGARQQQQQQQQLLAADALGSTAIGEANLPPSDGPMVHNSNGSLDTVDSSGANDTNNNHKGYRNFNHRRYQSDEGPGFIGVRNGKSDRTGGGSPSGSSEMASGESDDTIGEPDPTRKRDKFTISFLNTHRSSGLQNGGHGKSMLNHKFIVYNSKKPKTSSVLHQQYYQQSIAAAGELGNGSGSPPLPMPYQSHYQQYLYNRLRPSLSTSVLSSPSLISGTAAAAAASLGTPLPLGRSDQGTLLRHDREQLEQQHQLYQNGLFHQQHRALLGTPPAAIPGWAKSTSCLVTDSVATSSSYRTVTASPLLLLPEQPVGSLARPAPASSSMSSLSSSPSSFSAGSPPSSGANSSSNTPPPPVSSEVPTPPNAAPSSTAPTTSSSSSSTPTTPLPVASKTPTSPPAASTSAPSTPTHSTSPPPSPASNIDVDVRGVPRFDRSTKPASVIGTTEQQQQQYQPRRFQHQQRSFELQHSVSTCEQQRPHHQQAEGEEEEDSLLVSRRNSTGSSVALNGMNSHTAAINLQHPGTGQTAVVGHHRGFSSTVVAAANSAAASASATDCPWFLPHQMPPPPTAPARQHKRPAPQPGGGSVGGGGGGPGNHMQPPQFISPPPAPQQQHHQQQQQQQQQHSQQPAIVPPPQLPPHTVNPSLSSIHHPVQQQLVASQSAQQQQQQQQSHQPPIPPHPAVHHIPKSPNQHHPPQQQSMQTPSVQQHNPVSSAVGGVLTNNHHPTGPSATGASAAGPSTTTVAGNVAASLMSTSMNSAQLQGHILQPVGGLTGSALSIQQQQQQQQQQSVIPPGTQQVHHMSNSLHGPIGIPSVVVPPAGHDGSNGVGGPAPGWNCVPVGLSSPTTSAAAAAQRRAEVNAKLNAMPWFHGRIKREEAESLLKPREDGLFLVRESTNFPGDYTLCVCFNEKVEHYRIKYVDNKLTIDDDEYFDHLGQLVEHYTLDSDGLCTKLMKALPKEEFCVKDFQDNGWEIKMEDLQLKENIGKGEFGDVMLGILKGEKVAVKVLKDAGRASNKFLAEAGVMTTLEHENLVKFIGLVFHDKYIYLVTEYMSKGSLVDYLRSRGRQHISRKDQINFAYDTCCGMEYLETKKVIHRDLAARNVLISEDCVAKVSDFGLARDERYTGDSSKLPIKWTAPEALKEGKFSNKTDMWSFGILLWEIYSFGRVPYPRIPLADVVKHVGSGYKMEAPEGCPPEIYEMMRQAWDLVPEKRPTFAELKRRLYNCKRETANTYVT
ncbi:methylcytosine dioxygenase TET [Anopheles moucheti]|uniref:methylcytosine dioxygenase TET n=1 Tax=Anopheles moucheti TaxID=186751 RepID=UPI0022F0CCC1|nr:methylcytosine dioxygenase TET [Anopheles moucheti]